MKLSIQTLRAVVVIGLVAASATAFAAKGFSVTQAEEQMVKVDMTADEVRAAIGRPSHTHKYRNSVGPTWVYSVNFAPVADTTFQIDFNTSGRVQSMGEVVPYRRGQDGYLGE
jgi:outer membrane protein assembly factor BamE (lipoprotein component of BamABCDE complex)